MELLQFIFSSFWIYIGVLILIGAIAAAIVYIIHAFYENHYYRSMTKKLMKEIEAQNETQNSSDDKEGVS